MSMSSESGWREALAEYIGREARPVDKFGHQPRLYALTRAIGLKEPYDDDVVYAAAWLHDLGVFTGHRPEDLEALARWDNVAYALDQAPAVLERLQFPRDKIPSVLEAMRTHQPSGDPTTIEGTILRDADILEQLGAIGIMRMASKIGRDTRFPTFTAVVEVLRRAVTVLPGQLRTQTARDLAAPRIRVLQDFLAAAETESSGALF
jgi:uncharacterized protein